VRYLFFEDCISDNKVSKELGKMIKKDSDANDLPACKEMLNVGCRSSSDNNFHLRRVLFPKRPAIT